VLENGKNVFPEEIEEHLSAVEEISECVVVGRKDKRTGNIILTALIYPDLAQFKGKDSSEIKSFFKGKIEEINRDLVSYKRVQKIEIVENPFEKTTSRKIKRHLVK
jgi:long-chain acyl-CoA synthetase